MTPEQLKQIRERADKATPGPWKSIRPGHRQATKYRSVQIGRDAAYTTLEMEPSDAKFISESRQDVPDLLDEVERLKEEVKELSRLRAANGHLEQELQVLRSREMCADDIADYAEDRAKLVAKIESLKSSNRELVEALRSVDDLLAYTTARFDLELPAEERFSMKLRAMKTHNAIFAAIAKHGETNE